MKIAVLVKRAPDTASVFKIAGDGKSVEQTGLKYVMSPYDEYAVEEAIKLKEASGAEVILVSAGPAEARETIRGGLAMGADSGYLVTGEGLEKASNRGIAKVLAAAVRKLSADLVLAGKQAVDDDASQTPERVAELLDLPHASAIVRFELQGEKAVVDREVEGGHYTLEVPLPALFTAQKGLNTPRYPTLPNIMKAKKKPIEEVSPADLGLSAEDLASDMDIEALSLPRQNRRCHLLSGDIQEQARELVHMLRDEEKVF